MSLRICIIINLLPIKMKAVFTICSNNYLGQAKVLMDSINEFAGDYVTYVILCDKMDSQIDYSLIKAQIIEVEKLEIENFQWMIQHYSIVELNTAIKPFSIEYLFNRNYEYVIYLDPDICVYNSFKCIENELGDGNVLLTPHSYSPIGINDKKPNDCTFLNYGIYNLGFIALKYTRISLDLLQWWKTILSKYCVGNETLGLFVDQLPMNLAPLYFEGVIISRNRGLNMSWWNIHDRKLIEKKDNIKMIDDGSNLVFFHFSNYKVSEPDYFSQHRYNGKCISDYSLNLKCLYDEYRIKLIDANELYSKCKCYYNSYSLNLKIKFFIRDKIKMISYKLAKIASKI